MRIEDRSDTMVRLGQVEPAGGKGFDGGLGTERQRGGFRHLRSGGFVLEIDIDRFVGYVNKAFSASRLPPAFSQLNISLIRFLIHGAVYSTSANPGTSDYGQYQARTLSLQAPHAALHHLNNYRRTIRE